MLLEESPVTPYPSSSAEVPNCFVQCFSVFAISSEQPKANVGQKVGLSFKLEGLHGFDDKDQGIKYV